MRGVVLPDDVWELVRQHGAAMSVQRAFRARSLFRHARHPDWSRVRRHLGTEVWAELLPYAGVRREWRREPGSWVGTTRETLDVIRAEARDGLWGAAVAL